MIRKKYCTESGRSYTINYASRKFCPSCNLRKDVINNLKQILSLSK